MQPGRTERTTQGDQYVIPGAERRTAPRTVHSAESDGQLLLGELAPVTDADRLELRRNAPLRPRKGQKPPPAGLFRPKA